MREVCLLAALAWRSLAAAQGLACDACHGSPGPGRVAAPLCQSCHTGTALRNSGRIRFRSAMDESGKPRQAADATFGVPLNLRYAQATGHGGLKCVTCHGEPHQQPHARVLADCAPCHQKVDTIEGGPHGLHPLGEQWIAAHGLAVDEAGAAACRKCHGTDERGTVLSRAQAERRFQTRYGEKRFARGTPIGCYSCHAGPSPA
ncbi:MAG TPA: hypothetical protein VFA33_02405 [Bryobacteraceae bacterium]|nr:hypothetical protein [Bryobacteraceae bacterium]